MPSLSTTLALLQLAGFAILVWRLTSLGLTSAFRWFAAFCLFEPARILVALRLPHDRNIYGYFFFTTQAIAWVLMIQMILEVFGNALSEHRGIYTAARRGMLFCVIAAVIVAGATVGIDMGNPDTPYRTVEFFVIADRTVMVSLLLFVIGFVLLLSWFPVPLNRNVLLHSVVFTFFFASRAVLLFSRNVFGPAVAQSVYVGLVAMSLLCILLWAWLLLPVHKAGIVKSGITRSPEEEQRLIRQLESINETLGGTFRK